MCSFTPAHRLMRRPISCVYTPSASAKILRPLVLHLNPFRSLFGDSSFQEIAHLHEEKQQSELVSCQRVTIWFKEFKHCDAVSTFQPSAVKLEDVLCVPAQLLMDRRCHKCPSQCLWDELMEEVRRGQSYSVPQSPVTPPKSGGLTATLEGIRPQTHPQQIIQLGFPWQHRLFSIMSHWSAEEDHLNQGRLWQTWRSTAAARSITGFSINFIEAAAPASVRAPRRRVQWHP